MGDLETDLWCQIKVFLLLFVFFFSSAPRSGPWGVEGVGPWGDHGEVGLARGTGPRSGPWWDLEKSPRSAREDCECFMNAFVSAL